MANVLNQFLVFHDAIKLDDENEILVEKREIILKKLKEKISPSAPGYSHFVQGSYAMSTGVKPIDGREYDIDVGLLFNMSTEDHKPVEAKKWVFEALYGHTDSVEMKNPCITVTYKNQPPFHVDITVYAANNPDGHVYLAKGRPNSTPEKKFWELSDPQKLTKLVKDWFTDPDDRAQFRRVVRYMKRWKDEHFPDGGHAAPTGIGLTVSAMEYMEPNFLTDKFTNKRTYNDLAALKNLIKKMLGAFMPVIGNDGKAVERLMVYKPTPPYEDLFEKMTDSQMTTFKAKLESLLKALEEAEAEVDPVEACEILKKQFGNDFPVPLKEDTAQWKRAAIVTGSASA
ncbi:MAG: nucleotidyltransferase [Bacillota bacterium]